MGEIKAKTISIECFYRVTEMFPANDIQMTNMIVLYELPVINNYPPALNFYGVFRQEAVVGNLGDDVCHPIGITGMNFAYCS